MNGQIIRHEGTHAAIQALRTLLTLDGDEILSIAKTAVNDGVKGLAGRGISLIQRWNETRFGQALLDELEEMRTAGRIREDFHETDAGASTLREFFEMINGKPDEERFRAFCALFMSANAPDATSSEAILDTELMGILRSLSAGEMHLLWALLKIRSYKITSGTDLLMGPLAKELGYNSPALIGRNIKALLDGGLIRGDTWENQGGAVGSEKQLLTDLGLKLLARVEAYNSFKESKG